MPHHKISHQQLVESLHHQINISGGTAVSVLLIVLRRTDRMKEIAGIISSQSVMQHVDNRLDSLLRPTDRFAHINEEQILLVLPGLSNSEHSELAANRILSALRESFLVSTHSVTLRPYIGIANYPETSLDKTKLLLYADLASRVAATAQAGFYVYQHKDIKDLNLHDNLDVELEKAIAANELRVNFQPKIDIKTGRCISAEALVRWSAPWKQEVNPELIVVTAEKFGLINTLTLWILNTALRHAAAFSAAGLNLGISVNLPPKMLEDVELPQIIQQALDIWGVPASSLTLEITESSMIGNIESSLEMLTKLRGLGLRLSIDDFGTGYSSLAYLKLLPVQELKIDILFVKNIHNSNKDKQLVRAIIDLAHNFDLSTVAEGVEDLGTFELLRELGCDVVQGFLFSPALSEAEFIQWSRQHN